MFASKSRRVFTIFVLTLIVAISSVGLSSAQEQVTIYGMVNDAFARIWLENLVPAFNEKYPNIEVVIDPVPYGELLPKQLLELTSGAPSYDFIVTDDPWLPQLAATGLLMDLKTDLADVTDPDYNWDDFAPGALAAGEWNGGQYSVPVRSNLLLMFYNRTLFEEAGLEEPGEGYSWDDLAADLPQLVRDTDGDGTDDVWGIATYFGRDPLTPTIWQAIFNSNGGQLFDAELNPTFNTPEGIEALQYHIDLAQYGPPGVSAYTFTDTLEAFRQGRVAVMFNWGSVYHGVAINPETTSLTAEQVGVAPLPGGSAVDSSSHRGIWTAAIPREAANPEAAWTFIQWMTSQEGEVFTSATVGQFPARISTLTGEAPQDWLVDVFAAINAGYDAIGQGDMWRPRLPDSDGVQQILALHHSRAMTGDVTPEQALADAEAEIIEFLTDKGYYD
ncbi:MAG: sugar ABC transporter substrate-binding protein [Chloroflexota bacterium]|nr:MAG: sugar ABC transporter substrate-binding protein [Chloroflexota bacterium]